jgi:hypothetical protein
MLKLTGRTSHRIQALVNEGFVVENVTASTCEVHGYESWLDLSESVSRSYYLFKDSEDSHYAATGRFAQQVGDIADDSGSTPARVRQSMRRGHLTALASVRRYVEAQAELEAETPAPEVVEKVVAKQRKAQEKREAKRANGNPCQCECGGKTGGGRYLPGHDAKHKSALVKLALGGDQEAVELLGNKGWTRFLDKAREVAARPKADPRVKRAEREQSDQERAQENLARLARLKAAGEVLKGLGRYGKSSGDRRVPVTRENAQAIADGRFDFDAWDAAEDRSDWAVFVKAEA